MNIYMIYLNFHFSSDSCNCSIFESPHSCLKLLFRLYFFSSPLPLCFFPFECELRSPVPAFRSSLFFSLALLGFLPLTSSQYPWRALPVSFSVFLHSLCKFPTVWVFWACREGRGGPAPTSGEFQERRADSPPSRRPWEWAGFFGGSI